MAAVLRCATRRLLLGGRGIQRTPAVAAGAHEGWRLSPRFTHGRPSPSSRGFSSHQRGDRPYTFEEKVALWKRGGHLLYRTTNVVATFVVSYYILKLSMELAVNEFRERGYMVREARSLIMRAEDKLRSLRDR